MDQIMDWCQTGNKPDSPHKGPVTWKMFLFYDIIMIKKKKKKKILSTKCGQLYLGLMVLIDLTNRSVNKKWW